MKHQLFTVWAFALLACANAKPCSDDIQVDKKEKSLQETESKSVAVPCSDMPFFKKGSEIISKDFDQSGKELASQTTQVLEVTEQGGFTIAKVKGIIGEVTSGKETEVNFGYKCDGTAVFFDIASLYRTEANAKDSKFKAGEYSFPLHVQTGEMLPDISSTMETERGGKTQSMTMTISNRKVEGKETITTEAGTWETFKISNELKMDLILPGMDAKMKEMIAQIQAQNQLVAIIWFAPDLGIVKSETYKNGVLEFSNRIVSIKTLTQ